MKQYYELLQASPLFAGIAEQELQAMLSCLGARMVSVAKGETIFYEGDPAGSMGMVLEGTVQVVRDDFYGNRSLLAYAGPGELFAEAFACAARTTLPVSVCAVKEGKVLLMDCSKMLTVCSNACHFHSKLVENLLRVVAEKNLSLDRKIRIMSHKTTKEKLLAYLTDYAKRCGSGEFTIPLDRQELADYLGVERSAMSWELSKLKKEGVLDCKGPWFKLYET